MTSPEKQRSNAPRDLDKFHELEIPKVFDAMLSIQNLRIQLGTFFGTANLTGLGFAFSTQKAGLVFLSATTLAIFIFLDIIARGTLLCYYYRALILQSQFAPDDKDTYLDIFLSPATEYKIKQMAKIPRSGDRFRALRRLPITSPTMTGFGIPLISIAIELAIGVFLLTIFKWNLF